MSHNGCIDPRLLSQSEAASQNAAANTRIWDDEENGNALGSLPRKATMPAGSGFACFICFIPGCTASYAQKGGLTGHIKAKHTPYGLLCPMRGCPRGIPQNGFKRKDRLVTHLVNQNSDGKISTGHGIANVEAQRIAIDLHKRAQGQEGNEGTSGPTTDVASPIENLMGTSRSGEGHASVASADEMAYFDMNAWMDI